MAMLPGDIECTTGLAKRIYDNWLNAAYWRLGVCGLNVTTVAGSDPLKAMAYGVARAVVDEIVANSDVHTGGTSSGQKVR